ncbi:MAG: glycosyltransferase [Chloroflexota bacterium]|nr:MAG: glycosyltransferase [Chloroflexota bacterium]
MSRRRVAFVIHRYGRGGAEYLCQVAAERLAQRHDVTVLTTCAIDHETWANALPAGESVENGVRIRRFPTKHARSPDFNAMLGHVLSGHATVADERAWLRAQGPHSPELLDEIARTKDTFDTMFFVTYLYEPTAIGLQLAPERAVLIPTAHDEPPIRASVFRELFRAPRHIMFLTPAERRFVHQLFGNHDIPSTIASMGLEPVPDVSGDEFRARHGIAGHLLVYLGRVEGAKGCEELVEWMRAYPRSGEVTLALVGQNVMRTRSAPPILPLGIVSDREKHESLRAATVFIMPSAYESLSIATLEAWQHGVPVLVNQGSEVLVDHVRASKGGLYFRGKVDLAAALDTLLDDPSLRHRMGLNGQRYVAANYTWERVDAAYDRVIEEVAAGRQRPRSPVPRGEG